MAVKNMRGVQYVYLEISDTGPQSGQVNRQDERLGSNNTRRERKRVTEGERRRTENLELSAAIQAAGPWRR